MSNNEFKKVPLEEVFSSKGRFRVLKTLILAGELNVSEISRRSRLNHAATLLHLEFFKKIGIII